MAYCVFTELAEGASLPYRAHPTDSGWDIRANEDVTIPARGFARIHTGVSCELPTGYELQLRPRSGLTFRGIIGGFGTIDNEYRGEICSCLYNFTDEPYEVKQGDRIGQLVAMKVCDEIKFFHCKSIYKNTSRGENGFGSTGV